MIIEKIKKLLFMGQLALALPVCFWFKKGDFLCVKNCGQKVVWEPHFFASKGATFPFLALLMLKKEKSPFLKQKKWGSHTTFWPQFLTHKKSPFLNQKHTGNASASWPIKSDFFNCPFSQ